MGGAHREWGVDPQGQCWGLQKLPWSVTGIDVFCFVADFIISHNIVKKKFVIFCKEKNYHIQCKFICKIFMVYITSKRSR